MSFRESIAALLPLVGGRHHKMGSPDNFAGEGTVMTWDIVEFSRSLEGRHPQELLSVLGDVVGVCARSVEESSGRVLQSIGGAGRALWLPSPSEPSHALRAFRCGASICRRLSQPKPLDPGPCVRIALGTGAMVGGFTLGRYQLVGSACTTAKRLHGLDLPRRTSMLYTSETLAFVEGEAPRTGPVARFTKTTGEEVEVYEYCDHGS
jgi:class 3 adenylate cyclase